MTNPNPLTDNELQAAAYFAVGVTSEGSIAGRDVAYRLSFAGNVGAGGRMEPVANSGYSLGTLQIDLGQHPDVALDLLDAADPDIAGVLPKPRSSVTRCQIIRISGRKLTSRKISAKMPTQPRAILSVCPIGKVRDTRALPTSTSNSSP